MDLFANIVFSGESGNPTRRSLQKDSNRKTILGNDTLQWTQRVTGVSAGLHKKNMARQDFAAKPMDIHWKECEKMLTDSEKWGAGVVQRARGKGGCGPLHSGQQREGRAGRGVTLHCRWDTSPGSDTATDTPY